MTSRVILFDLDGPILDVSEKYYRLHCDLVAQLGGRPLSKAAYWEAKRQSLPDAEILGRAAVVGQAGGYRAHFREAIETPRYLAHDQVWPGVHHLLGRLSRCHRLALVTLRHCAAALHAQLRQLDLLAPFERVLSAPHGEVGAGRADVKVALVRDWLRADALDGWFIGDTETDVRAGQTLGLRTMAVTFGIRAPQCLASARPDLLLHSPAELIAWGAAQCGERC